VTPLQKTSQPYQKLHADVFDAAGMAVLAAMPAAPLAELRAATLGKVAYALKLDARTRELARDAAAARDARDAYCGDGGFAVPLLDLKQRPSDVGGDPFLGLAEARGPV
jgi:hypothetical protein